MADKKTILLPKSENDKPTDFDKKPLNYYLRVRKGGIGGTIGEVKKKDKSKIKLKWRAGIIKGTPGATKQKTSRLQRKSMPGFRIEVKF